jgi:hypothetical protein
VPEGLHLCTINPAGFIETVDGARIRFDGRGYGLRNSEKYQTNLTRISANILEPIRHHTKDAERNNGRSKRRVWVAATP